jgi:hypothetical protein
MTIFTLKRTLSSSTQTNNCILFPTLPIEIREQIYSLIIFLKPRTTPHNYSTVSAADAIHGADPRYPSFLPKLCRVSEATRLEVGLFFIRNTEFGLLYPQHCIYFAQFLRTFPANDGFAAIRRLDFQLFSRHRPDAGQTNAYIELMKKCEGVTEVRMKFEMWYLLKHRLDYSSRTQFTLDELEQRSRETLDLDRIVAVYRLEGLLELLGLTRLTIEVWPRIHVFTTVGIITAVPDCWPLMEGLVEWVRKGFAERGRRVEVRLVESGNAGLRWAEGVVRA